MLRNLNDLEIFVSVAEHKSFTAAARAVQLSTSAVSKYMTNLEESLGAPLLHRSTHHLVLTEAGLAFYRHCTHVLAEMDEAVNEIGRLHQDITGHLRVFAPLCVGQNLIAPAITEFMQTQSRITVEFTTYPGAINLLEHRMDIVVRSKWSRVPDRSIVSRQLGLVPYIVCATPSYVTVRGTPDRPAMLTQHNCLIHTTQDDCDTWSFRVGARDQAVRVAGTFSSNNSAAVRVAALGGLGIARLPHYLVREDLTQRRLVALFPDAVRSNRLIAAYYPRSRSAPAKVRALLDFLADYCAAHSAPLESRRGKNGISKMRPTAPRVRL